MSQDLSAPTIPTTLTIDQLLQPSKDLQTPSKLIDEAFQFRRIKKLQAGGLPTGGPDFNLRTEGELIQRMYAILCAEFFILYTRRTGKKFSTEDGIYVRDVHQILRTLNMKAVEIARTITWSVDWFKNIWHVKTGMTF
jgi:hypothetical protein